MRLLFAICLVAALAFVGQPPTALWAQGTATQDLNGDGILDEDANGNGVADQDEVPMGNVSELEIACVTYGTVNYCLPYHELFCQNYGMADACRLAAMGAACRGGDPATCDYYGQLMAANRDCNLSAYQPACDWLAAQQF